MITCRELADFIADYLSGELPPADRARFEEHLAVCPTCVRYVRSYGETIRLGKTAFTSPDEPVPEDVPERLIRGILATRPARG